MQKTNYILVDFENVQPPDMQLLDHESIQIRLFLGAHQTKIPVSIATILQRFGTRVEYISIQRNGSNAVDFHIAYYLGRLISSDATAYYHIISKDTGYDPLIQHLKAQKIRVFRTPHIRQIPLIRASLATSLAERIAVVMDNLVQRKTSCPRTEKTLTSTIRTIFQQALNDEEIFALIQALQKQGTISIHDSKITYHFPAETQ
ncbi:MAG: hypothetical protein KAX40_03060 [Herpetosiphon sp.]|nr:hypothetical protein [Herpetosiphon sp.]